MSHPDSAREKGTGIPPVFILSLVAVADALFFAAGGREAGLGLLFLFGGVMMAFYPPAKTLPRSWLILFAGLLVLALFPFVPGFSFLSGSWRNELANIHGIKPSGCLTLQPWITFESELFLLFGVGLFYYWVLQVGDRQIRRPVLRWLGALFVFFYSVVILVYFTSFAFPSWSSPRNLGPFENRNQLSSFLAVSLLLLTALFANDLKKHRGWAILWGSGAFLGFYLLILNFSRGGVVLLFLGGVTWMFLNFKIGMQKGRLSFAFIVMAVLFSAFFIFGGETLARFEKAGDGLEFAGSTRLSIQQDALALIKDQPFSGVGLGNFAEVFPQYRDNFQSDAFVRHPESDWLWFVGEAGFPGVLAFLILGVLWLRQVFPLKSGSDKHFRSICLVCVLVMLAQGFVDVPLHRAGVVIPVIFLASLAVRPLQVAPSRPWMRRGWMVIGILLGLWGAATLIESTGTWSKPGEFRVQKTLQGLPKFWSSKNSAEGVASSNLALGSAPLSWELYYWRATFLLQSGNVSGARDDFRRARFLEKTSSNLPMNESLQWLPVRPDLALAAANEMLQRSRYATDQKYGVVAAEAQKLGKTDFLDQLRLVARRYPEVKHHYLETAPEEDFDLWLNDDEQNFRDREQNWFWELLKKRKSGDELLEWSRAQPDRLNLYYRPLADILAGKEDWQQAFMMVKNHMPAAVVPLLEESEPARKNAAKQFVLDPSDLAAASQVIQLDLLEGHAAAALEKLTPLLSRKDAPPYFFYLSARANEATGEWQKAFADIRKYDELRSKQQKN